MAKLVCDEPYLKPTAVVYPSSGQCMRNEIRKYLSVEECPDNRLCYVDLIGGDYVDHFVTRADARLPAEPTQMTLLFGRPGHTDAHMTRKVIL